MSEEGQVEITAHQFYDRQRRAVGAKCMEELAKAKVLICGLTGLGVEIAKNVILTGPGAVFLFDPAPVTAYDLSSNFYATEEDVAAGRNRVDAAFDELKELNPYVVVEKVTEKPDLEWMVAHGVTVFVGINMPLNEEFIALNQACRDANIKFISTTLRGLTGQLFVDAGIGFSIYDSNGEPPSENMVIDISPIEPEETEGEEEEAAAAPEEGEEEEKEEPDTRAQMLVTVYDDKINHGLGNGDKVTFKEVPGMPALVEMGEIDIEPVGRHTFKIFLPEGTEVTDVGTYSVGHMGYCKQVKGNVIVNHQGLAEQINEPTLLDYDFAKFGYSQYRLHPLYRALDEFIAAHDGECPRAYNEEDANEVFELAKKFNENLGEDDEDFCKQFAFTARGNLNPMAAFFGGFAAQEVQIVATGKYTPLNQWFYFDALECLPKPLPTEEDAIDFEPSNRYQGQILVFGKTFFEEKIRPTKLFMVGAGALGCEYLKNFALMGIATDDGSAGEVVVTDMDVVETSNLNRQFLFRQRHIQKLKSTSAAETVTRMNPAFKVTPHDIRVGPETEDFFNQSFWMSLDLVVNALDNVHARLYVDSKIVEAKKPLVEAGTTGPQANLQIIVPKLTESYSDQRDPPEKRAPQCTLKNFPYQIAHCIAWARDAFEKIFKNRPMDVNTYVQNPAYLEELPGNPSAKIDVLSALFEHITNRPKNFTDCVHWARLRFADFFQHNIAQLLDSFPADYVDPKTNQPFWTGSKRTPTIPSFDFEDELHRAFLISTANLCAEMFGIAQLREEFDYVAALADFEVPEFVPKKNVKIETDVDADAETEAEGEDADSVEEAALAELIAKLPPPDESMRMNAISFEKDDPTNYHIAFVTATSNNRGWNYSIPPADEDKTKGIAGRIIPAMVTTTAMITGVGCLEVYKVIQMESRVKEDYKNTFLTLALPAFYQSEPADPKKLDDGEFTKWDSMGVDLGRDVTIGELIDYFKTEHNAVAESIAYNNGMMYCTFLPGAFGEDRLAMKVSEAAFQFCPEAKRPSAETVETMQDLFLTILFEDDVLEVPVVAYRFNKFE